jgi:hypothetical protein
MTMVLGERDRIRVWLDGYHVGLGKWLLNYSEEGVHI